MSWCCLHFFRDSLVRLFGAPRACFASLKPNWAGGFGSARTAFCCSGLETHSEIRSAGESKIQSFPRLGGLHHRYAMAA